MEGQKRKRIINKLRGLADSSRNPDAEEVEAANAKLEKLLREEQKETEGALLRRMEMEPMEFRTLFDWEREPKVWERSLFGFICRINFVKGVYTITGIDHRHLLRAAGRPSHTKKAELQFLWAFSRIEDVSKRLPPNTRPEYRESYEFGAARELVEVMKSVSEIGNSTEAAEWLRTKTDLLENPKKELVAFNPYWKEGRKSLKRSFYPEE